MTERELFEAALDLPEEGRAAFLAGACGGDAALRQRVEALLHKHEQAGSFLEDPAVTAAAAAHLSPAGAPGLLLAGRYKLLEQIGEGGMGSVWMAQQTEPVKRLVAVKLIKPGMDSRPVLTRFEAERQALALMDHPHIAKVHDAGAAPDGRPFFVMELVKGVPITTYCDERRLTPRQRLELFVPVCQAVQHAHQKGIIHRDLKPTNVLVALYDDQPVPKVIDFGVAKATGQQLTEATLHTGFGAVVGTLEYMSPEQASLNQLDVDTRSDIYSLGVLLYELLTGTTPLPRQRVQEHGLLEALRLIREEDAPTLSQRLSTTGELASIAAKRGLESARLTRLVRGELDWIVMRALEKARNRRYETANSLAADVERYLHNEPVQACPPSAAYRMRKLVQRNKVPVLAAAVVLLTLVVGIAGTTWALVEARRQRDDAQEQRHKAEANRRKAHQAVHDYFTLVSESTLLDEPALEPLRKQLLQAALRYYEEFVQEHRDDPELQGELAATYLRISGLSYEMGPEEDWLPPMQQAIAILEEMLRQNPALSALESLKSGINYGNAITIFHVRDQQEALRTLEKARTLWEELVRLDPTAPGFRNSLAVIHVLTGVLHEYGTSPPAEWVRSVDKAIALWQQLSREEPSNPRYRAALATSLRVLGMYTAIAGDFSRSEEAMRRARQTAAQLAADFPKVPGIQELLHCIIPEGIAFVQEYTGRLEEAEKTYREMLAGQEALIKQYPTVLRYQNGLFRVRRWLGWVLWGMDRRAEAAEEFRQMCLLGQHLSASDPENQDALAWLLATCPDPQFRDVPRALQLARKAVERVPRYGTYWTTLGAAHYAAGDYQAAVRALEKGVQFPNDWGSWARFFLAMAKFQLGEKDEARHWYDQGVARMEQHELWPVETLRIRAAAAKVLGIEAK